MREEHLMAAAILLALGVTIIATIFELLQRAPRRRRLNWSNKPFN